MILPFPPREGPPCLCVSEQPEAQQPCHSTMAGGYEAQGSLCDIPISMISHSASGRTVTPGKSEGFMAVLCTFSSLTLGKNDAPHRVTLRWFAFALHE